MSFIPQFEKLFKEAVHLCGIDHTETVFCLVHKEHITALTTLYQYCLDNVETLVRKEGEWKHEEEERLSSTLDRKAIELLSSIKDVNPRYGVLTELHQLRDLLRKYSKKTKKTKKEYAHKTKKRE